MVVFFHYSSSFLPDFIFNNFIIRESWSFVDFFFVLSGYVIVFNYKNINNIDYLWIYIKKRFIRLYPLLFFSTIVFFSFSFVSNLFLSQYVSDPKEIKTLLIETCNSLFLLNSTPVFGDVIGMNYPSWSVSSEFISYLVFGVLSLYFVCKRYYMSLIVIFISFILLSYIEYNSIFGDWRFLRGLIGFNTGVCIYYLSIRKFNINNNIEYFIPILIISYFYFFYSYDFEYKIILDLILRPLMFGLVILILLKTNNFISKILDTKPLKFLGKISYSIYLNHAIIIIIIPRICFKILEVSQNIFTEIFVFISCSILTVLYSYLTYKYIELGSSNYLKNIFLNKK